MSVPRYRVNKFAIPGLSDLWKGQPQAVNTQRSSRHQIKKKEIYNAYDHQLYAPLRIKSRKQSEASKKKREMIFSYQQRKDKGLGAYRYLGERLLNSSKKELQRPKGKDRSSLLQSYRPTSRASRNASTSRIEESYDKDIYRKLANRSKLQEQIEMAPRLGQTSTNDQLRRGKLLYNQGNIEEAESIFRQMLSDQASALECSYFLAIIAMRRGQYQEAIQRFNSLLKAQQNYKKSAYLFLAMAYKAILNIEQSLEVADRGLKIFPIYIDLLMYRAKLYMRKNNYEQAEKDYSAVISIKNDHSEAYLKKVHCLIQMNHLKKAMTILTTLLYIDEERKPKILQQRARLFFSMNQIEDCKRDIEKLANMKIVSSQICELKGAIEVSEGRITQGILCYQQCARLNTSKDAVERALIGITKCKINDLDYYSAYHQISRSHFLGIKSRNIEIFRLFTEGVVFLMKRKTQEGLNNLNTLLNDFIMKASQKQKVKEKGDRFQEHVSYILKRFYVYRAYGYFVIGQHELAIFDYNEGRKYTSVERHTRYNFTVAEAIVEVKNKNFAKAYNLFQKAKLIYPNKLEPLLYRAVTLVEKCSSEQPDEINRLESILSALKELDYAYDINPNHSNLLFLRALLYYYLGKINEGLESISRAMAKSQQNVPKYFYYRGLGNGSLKNYKQCQNDFTIVINLDTQYADAYLERAKTFFILGNIPKAMQDIDQYQKLRPQLDRNYLQGNLHFSQQDFQTALLKYENASPTQQTTLMKVKSYICIGELKFALTHLQTINSPSYYCDATVLKYLICSIFNPQEAIQQYHQALKQNVNISHRVFNTLQIYHYIGATCFQLGRYRQALEQFKRASKEREFLNIQHLINQSQCEDDETGQQAQIEINQINYNIFLCHLMLGEMRKAHELFMRHILPVKDMIPQGEILDELCHMVFQSIKGIDGNEEALNELDVTMFTNPLSQVTPNIVIRLKGGQLKTKLCHLLPSIVMKQMKPEVNQKLILSKIQLSQVENKPQPPWVRRNDESTLIFTGEIQDVGVQFQTQQNQQLTEYEQQQKTQEEQEQSSVQESERAGEGQNMRTEIQKLKNAFKLNESVERKLNTFIGKKGK